MLFVHPVDKKILTSKEYALKLFVFSALLVFEYSLLLMDMKVLGAFLALLGVAFAQHSHGKIVGCYWGTWSFYRYCIDF